MICGKTLDVCREAELYYLEGTLAALAREKLVHLGYRAVLCMGRSDSEAAEMFKEIVEETFKRGWSTQINWYIHSFAHRN